MKESEVYSEPPDQCYDPTAWMMWITKPAHSIFEEERILCQLWEANGRPDAWVAIPENFLDKEK